MLQNISVYFQWLPLPPGNSTRHTCDMKHRRAPTGRVGSLGRSHAFQKLDSEARTDALPASTRASMEALIEMLQVGRDIAERLLTDPKMESVWSYLLSEDVTADAIANLPDKLRMSHWGISERGVSLQEQACVALFAYVVIEFGQLRPAGTRRNADARAAPYFDAARICRVLVEDAPRPSPEEKHALELAATYIDEWTNWQLNQLKASPYTVGERSNERRGGAYRSSADITRGRVRSLTVMAQAIFPAPRPKIIATIATVALGEEIPSKSVSNWRRQ
jgi:hypothetical protein